MKTATKSKKLKEGTKNIGTKKSAEIKPDFPLSEKDEVKKAEKNLNESQKKNS